MLEALDSADQVVLEVQAPQLALVLQIRDLADPVVLQPQTLQARVPLEVLDEREACNAKCLSTSSGRYRSRLNFLVLLLEKGENFR